MTFGIAGRYGAYLPIVAGLYLSAILKNRQQPSPRYVDNNQVPIQRYPMILPNGQGGNQFPVNPGTFQGGQGQQGVPINFQPGGYYPLQQYSGGGQGGAGQTRGFNGGQSQRYSKGPTEYSGQTGQIQPSTRLEVQGKQKQGQQNQGPTEYSGQTGQIQPSTGIEGQDKSTQGQQNQGPTEYSGQTGQIQPSTRIEDQYKSTQGQQNQGPTEYSGQTGQIQPSTRIEGQYKSTQGQPNQGPTEYSGQTGQIQPSTATNSKNGNGGRVQAVPYPSPGQRQVRYVPRIQVQYRPVQQVVRRVQPQPQYTVRGKRQAEEFFRAYDYEMEKREIKKQANKARDLEVLFRRVITRTMKRVPRHKYLQRGKQVIGKPYKTFQVNLVLSERFTFDL